MALCTDCTAKIEYQGDGSQTLFTFNFTYMESTDVYVAQYDDTTKEYINLIGGTDWSFENDTTIRIEPAPTYKLAIYRCTELDPLKATFFAGHPIKADDLNDNFNQLQSGIEDARCSISGLKEDLDENYWNNHSETVGCPDPWVSDDKHVATTCAIDNRFWDNVNETLYFSDDFRNSDSVIATAAAIEKRFWNNVKDDDSTYTTSNWLQHVTCPNDYVPTTGAVEQRLNDFYTRRDFTDSIVTGVDQRTGQWNDYNTDDKHVPTTDAVVERHDTHYNDAPLSGDYIQPGKFWVNTLTQRLAYWNDQGYWVHTGAMPANDAPPVYVSNEAPEIADEGDLWYNTGDGLMYVYYCPDPSGSCQWVSIGGGAGGGDGTPGNPGGIDTQAPIEHTYNLVEQVSTIKFRINSLTSIA